MQSRVMSKNIVYAALVAVGLAAWLGSGYLQETGTAVPQSAVASAVTAEDTLQNVSASNARVRVSTISSELRTREVVLSGRTESKRTVDVKAEIAGAIVSRPVERGTQVEKGDLLCEIAVDDREVAVQEARAALATARIEHQGSLKLKTRDLLSDVAIASSEARQEAALAHLHRQELNLARTRVEAPFAGVVEALPMNIGDYAVPGATCATLIDLDPMLVVANVNESEVSHLLTSLPVTGTTVSGRQIEGNVTFVGRQSDPATRTYPVEITVENRDYSLRSGLTVSLSVGVEQVPAHRVSPSLLSLNDEGELGLRIVDELNRVAFVTVEILDNDEQGLWITGLPQTVNLITVGQEYVAVGDVVEPVFSSGTVDQLAGL